MRENLRVKICGITKPEQGAAIAEIGVTALGFICVASSPRYVSPPQICRIVAALKDYPQVDRIGVFVNATIADIATLVTATGLTGVQLHGTESPVFCQDLRHQLPGIELIKAIRVKQSADLSLALTYAAHVDTLLLDAYDPKQWGGTGHTLDWQALQTFAPPCPWLLAGGLTPGNVGTALGQLRPQGIDLSSGVEVAPGDKNLHRIADLFRQLAHLTQGDSSVGGSAVSKA